MREVYPFEKLFLFIMQLILLLNILFYIYTVSATHKPTVENGDFIVKSDEKVCVRAMLKATFTVKYASVRSGKVSICAIEVSKCLRDQFPIRILQDKQF